MTAPDYVPPKPQGWWVKRNQVIFAPAAIPALVGAPPQLQDLYPTDTPTPAALSGSAPTIRLLTPIVYVSAASALATSVAMPTHAAGDTLLVFAFRSGSTTAPGLPAGWTNLGIYGANSCACRIGYKTAASSAETSGTWSNASAAAVGVYRNVVSIGAPWFGTGSGTDVTWPALGLINNNHSHVVGFAGHRSRSGTPDAPTGMVQRTSATSGSFGACTVNGCDTNGPVGSWPGGTKTGYNSSGSGWVSLSLELLDY